MIKILTKAKNYKQFLNQMLENPLYGRGAKTRLAAHLKVQSSFISLVLSGPQDFSPDHSIKIADFLKLDTKETEFFMHLVLRDRAGTATLRAFYQAILERMIADELEIKSHIPASEVEFTEGELAEYYGAWYHAAVHMAIHDAAVRDVQSLVAATGLKERQVRESIDLLVRVGFAKFEKDKVLPLERKFHLSKKSLALRAHHTNWRHQAIKSLDDRVLDDLHYSVVMNIDESTMKKIREMLMDAIKKSDQFVNKARIEGVYSMCLDLFKVF